MPEIEVKLTCPLGHTCEKVVGDHIERCAWYTRIIGINPQTSDKEDMWKCAIAWQPMLMIENTKQQVSTSVAVESFRNETVKKQQAALGVLRDVGSLEHK